MAGMQIQQATDHASKHHIDLFFVFSNKHRPPLEFLSRAEANRAVKLHLPGGIRTDAINLTMPSWPIWQRHLCSLWGVVSALLPEQHTEKHNEPSLSSPFTSEELPNHTRVHFVPRDQIRDEKP